MSAAKTIVVATHRRSGTHWTIDALRNNSRDIAETFLTLERISTLHDSPQPLSEFRGQLASHWTIACSSKVHDLPTAGFFQGDAERGFALQLLGESPTIYVHRDGRDVMVSLYYYLQSFSAEAQGQTFSAFLRSEAALDGVATGKSYAAYWAWHASSWLQVANLLPVSYADLETDYERIVKRMAGFLGVRLSRTLKPIVLPGRQAPPSLLEKARWKLGVRRKKLSSAVQPRRGGSGDWRNHFNADDLSFFESEAGEMMAQLGYDA